MSTKKVIVSKCMMWWNSLRLKLINNCELLLEIIIYDDLLQNCSLLAIIMWFFSFFRVYVCVIYMIALFFICHQLIIIIRDLIRQKDTHIHEYVREKSELRTLYAITCEANAQKNLLIVWKPSFFLDSSQE